jgi:hypothetical protein
MPIGAAGVGMEKASSQIAVAITAEMVRFIVSASLVWIRLSCSFSQIVESAAAE